MKKLVYLFLLSVGCFASCTSNPPTYNMNAISMNVGDSVLFEIKGGRGIDLTRFFMLSNDDTDIRGMSKVPSSDTICSIKPIDKRTAVVYALKAGQDTMVVVYSHTQGIYAYGEQDYIPVTIQE